MRMNADKARDGSSSTSLTTTMIMQDFKGVCLVWSHANSKQQSSAR